MDTGITREQRRLYSELYETYGDDARALFHADEASQHERFDMLARAFSNESGPFTVHEIGCALGHLGEFLRERTPQAVFSGSDIVEQFVATCRRRHPQGEFFVRDVSTQLPEDRYDFVVLCGTFNIPGSTPREQWQEFVYSMLRAMYAMAKKGIAATLLTTYYDPGRERSDLFYQDESQLMDFAVRELSRHFELDSAGPLYEYALRVYRPEYIHERYPQQGFAKYFKEL
jgi:Methyltransferase domain